MDSGGTCECIRDIFEEKKDNVRARFSWNVIPGNKETFDDLQSGIPFGALYSPLSNSQKSLKPLRLDPLLCQTCSIVYTPYSKINIEGDERNPQFGQWCCVFCGAWNECFSEEFKTAFLEIKTHFPDAGFVKIKHNDSKESSRTVLIEKDAIDLFKRERWLVEPFVEHRDQALGGRYHLLREVRDGGKMTKEDRKKRLAMYVPSYAFVIDESLTKTDFMNVVKALSSIFEKFPSNARVSLVVFSSHVKVFKLAAEPQSNTLECDIFDGSRSLTLDEARRIRFHATSETLGKEYCASFYEGGGKSILKILTELSERAPDETYVEGNDDLKGKTRRERIRLRMEKRRKQAAHLMAKRCLGAAVEVALNVIKSTDMKTGRCIILTKGKCNYGPGQILRNASHLVHGYYKSLAKEALYKHFRIDCVCVGASDFECEKMQPLVYCNGGSLLLLQNFGPGFKANISELLTGRVDSERMATASSPLELCTSVKVRCSSFVNIAKVVGPIFETNTRINAKDGSDSNPNQTKCDVRLTRNSSNVAVSVFFDLNKTLEGVHHAYFQFISNYSNEEGQEVVQILTKRIPVIFYQKINIETHINCGISAVLIAKHAVTRLLNNQTEEAQLECENQVYNMYTLNEGQNTSNVLSQISLPVYHFLHGPAMKSPIEQHLDDMTAAMRLVMYSNENVCLRAMCPLMFSHCTDDDVPEFMNNDQSFDPVPVHQSSLDSNKIFIMDCFTEVYLWYGSNIDPSTCTSMLNILRSCPAVVNRFPSPHIFCFSEGSSAARRLTSRLEPLETDTIFNRSSHKNWLLELLTES